MKRTHTLRSIAEDVRRDKRTVQTWYAQEKLIRGEFGQLVDGARKFSDEERGWLIAHRSDVISNPYEMEGGITVEPGNHHIVLSQPELPETYSLEKLRSSESTGFEDPLAIAEQFLQAADQIVEVMQADINAREQRLSQTKKAKARIDAKTAELALEARLYRLQTSQIDSAQTEETKDLQDSLTALQQLGKPTKNV